MDWREGWAQRCDERRLLVDEIMHELRTNGVPSLADVPGGVDDMEGLLASVEHTLRAMLESDSPPARVTDDGTSEDREKTVVILEHEALLELEAYAKRGLGRDRRELVRLREERERLLAQAADPEKTAAFVDMLEASLVRSERSTAQELLRYQRALGLS